jgi:hypothetical protein
MTFERQTQGLPSLGDYLPGAERGQGQDLPTWVHCEPLLKDSL